MRPGSTRGTACASRRRRPGTRAENAGLKARAGWFWSPELGSLVPFEVAFSGALPHFTLDVSGGYKVSELDWSTLLQEHPLALVGADTEDNRGWFADGRIGMGVGPGLSLQTRLAWALEEAMPDPHLLPGDVLDAATGLFAFSQTRANRLTGSAGLKWNPVPMVGLSGAIEAQLFERPELEAQYRLRVEAEGSEASGRWGAGAVGPPRPGRRRRLAAACRGRAPVLARLLAGDPERRGRGPAGLASRRSPKGPAAFRRAGHERYLQGSDQPVGGGRGMLAIDEPSPDRLPASTLLAVAMHAALLLAFGLAVDIAPRQPEPISVTLETVVPLVEAPQRVAVDTAREVAPAQTQPAPGRPPPRPRPPATRGAAADQRRGPARRPQQAHARGPGCLARGEVCTGSAVGDEAVARQPAARCPVHARPQLRAGAGGTEHSAGGACAEAHARSQQARPGACGQGRGRRPPGPAPRPGLLALPRARSPPPPAAAARRSSGKLRGPRGSFSLPGTRSYRRRRTCSPSKP